MTQFFSHCRFFSFSIRKTSASRLLTWMMFRLCCVFNTLVQTVVIEISWEMVSVITNSVDVWEKKGHERGNIEWERKISLHCRNVVVEEECCCLWNDNHLYRKKMANVETEKKRMQNIMSRRTASSKKRRKDIPPMSFSFSSIHQFEWTSCFFSRFIWSCLIEYYVVITH